MISLITPNYNGESWLDDCLSSVANQTAPQDAIEMVLVDDGSTDGSKSIVERYQKDIPGLHPVWHEHIGKPSFLRNLAMKRAMGDYVLFLDSDDFLGTEAIERLGEFSKSGLDDVVAFQLAGLDRKVPSSMLNETIKDADLVASGLYKTLGIWKMYRRAFLNDRNIHFDSTLGRGDDVPFSAEAMLKAEHVAVLSGYPFYTVRGREDGSSITQKEWMHDSRINVAKKVGQLANTLAADENIKNHFLIRIFNSDVIDILESNTVTDGTLNRIRAELSPYWSHDIASLIYTDENRQKLVTFFGYGKDDK